MHGDLSDFCTRVIKYQYCSIHAAYSFRPIVDARLESDVQRPIRIERIRFHSKARSFLQASGGLGVLPGTGLHDPNVPLVLHRERDNRKAVHRR